MVDVIIPTQAEVNSWIVLGVLALSFVIFLWIKGRQEEKRTVKWVRDWEEY